MRVGCLFACRYPEPEMFIRPRSGSTHRKLGVQDGIEGWVGFKRLSWGLLEGYWAPVIVGCVAEDRAAGISSTPFKDGVSCKVVF